MKFLKGRTVVACVATGLVVGACGGILGGALATQDIVQQEDSSIRQDLLVLDKAEPRATPVDSSNLHIQNAWYTAEADPHKTWYGELLSANGTLIKSYVTQGPAVDASDQVTNSAQPYVPPKTCYNGCGAVTLGLAEPDGTYDANSPELIAITAQGAIARIWVGSGDYVQQDQPFVTTQTPLLTESLQPPTPTNTAKTKNAFVPTAVKPTK